MKKIIAAYTLISFFNITLCMEIKNKPSNEREIKQLDVIRNTAEALHRRSNSQLISPKIIENLEPSAAKKAKQHNEQLIDLNTKK